MQSTSLAVKLTKLLTILTLFISTIQVNADTYTVTNTNDSGAGSLRQAILNANANTGYDLIIFSISGVSYQRINLTTLLPSITENAALIGRTQGGAGYNDVPLIELDGSSLPDKTYGLNIAAPNCSVNGFSIGGFTNGINLSANNNFIYGNYVGIYGDGTVNPNSIGINLDNASNNVIGTDGDGTSDDTEKNIASGNTVGIRLTGSGNNLIAGNYMGTSADGTTSVSNTDNGIQIRGGSNNNRIGGSTVNERNIISANISSGMIINNSNDNWVRGNYIGLDKTGTVDLGNKRHGIYVFGGSTGTIIGTNGDGVNDLEERNIIACNDRHADNGNDKANIRVVGLNTNNTTIAGNFIGISAEGKAFIPNGGIRGIQVYDQVSNILIGGSKPHTGNVISSHNHFAIEFINVSNSRISGNFIGTDTLGTSAIPNVEGGIQMWSDNINNVIGTNGDGIDDEQEGNLISGNTGNGVLLAFTSTYTFVAGNKIGTDVTGTAPLPNGLYGIISYYCTNNTYGGLLPAQRNIISGNTRDGLHLYQTSSNNIVLNNFIGVNITGTAALPNTNSGIVVNAPFNQIGNGTEEGRNIISGNLHRGIYITEANSTKVQGNYIGTDVTGMLNIGNTYTGIDILNGSKHTIIGTDSDGVNDENEGNLISCNDFRGGAVDGENANLIIRSNNTDSNYVAGNFIGSDKTGMALITNSGVRGIQVTGGTANTIGGRSVYARNIIGGMTHSGIEFDYISGDTVMNNYIGTNKTGTAALRNRVGLVLYGNANNHIMGTNGDGIDDHLEGNLISGNNTGMEVSGSHNNKISGNLIGTDNTGLNALPNETTGILNNNSNNNIFGGSLTVERNIISGNLHNGIATYGTSSGNKIYNNYIGTDINGTAALGNGHSGIYLFGSGNNVGSSNPAHRNIISGNLRDGIYIPGASTTANKVQGNYIGTDVTGMQDLGNGWAGIQITGDAYSNIIGSDEDGSNDASEGNVISCNHREGGAITANNANIYISGNGSNGNIIRGNLIGTDITGKAVIGPDGGARGIQLRGGSGTIIGGITTTARNIISGHKHLGIEIIALTQPAIIQGNYIGTDIDGLLALGNTNGGISLLQSHETLIGTDEDGNNDHLEGNVISANGRAINIAGSSHRNIVAGNLIGTDVTGNTALGNTITGVEIRNGNENHVGGTTDAGRNIISGNNTQGILFGGTTVDNLIYNNYIGLSKDSTTAIPNGSDGIRFTDNAEGNVIGGAIASLGNVIAYNHGDGINVVGGTKNSFRRNIFYENDALGIDLNNDDVTYNDLTDADSGPNNLQNFPFITAIDIQATTVKLDGVLYSEASKSYELDFYANSIPDPSGHGEAMVYLGTTTVMTDASGVASYSITFNKTIPAGYFITSTATDPDNNTSEFSGGYGDPLPVDLLKFEVSANADFIQLYWNVAEEKNVSKYIVYTSDNGIDFDSVGYVIADRSSAYQYQIYNHNSSDSYYKLKLLDKDGSFVFSQIRRIQESNQHTDILLFPNPASENVYIRLSDHNQNEVSVKIINAAGLTVLQNLYHITNNNVTVPVNEFSTGLYRVIVTTNERSYVKSLYIQ